MAWPMVLRVWTTEVRRHVGWFILLVWVGISCALLFTHTEWAGELSSLALYLRSNLIVLGPVAMVLAVWAGGRDRRRGLTELLETVPAAAWRRHAVRWASMTWVLCIGVLITFAVGAAFVLGHTTYLGGRWYAELLVGGTGLGALIALGMTIGAFVPWRIVAPVAGLATYVGLGVPGYLTATGFQNLLPNGPDGLFVAYQPTAMSAVALGGFFGALVVLALLLMSSGRRLLVAPIAVLAIGIGLAAGSQPPGWWSAVDTAAAAPVCATGTPRVCVMRTHAELLPAVAHIVRPVLVGMGEVAPPGGAQEVPISAPGDDHRILEMQLGFQVPLVGDHLLHPDDLRQTSAQSPAVQCFDVDQPEKTLEARETWIDDLEGGWIVLTIGARDETPEDDAVPGELSAATPAQRHEFLREYHDAGDVCDYAALHRLWEEWAR